SLASGGAVGASDPRALNGHPATAEGDRAGLARPAGRLALGIVLSLRAAEFGDLDLDQLAEGAEAEAGGEGHQALLCGAGEIAEGDLDGLGQLLLHRLVRGDDLRCGYGCHWRFLLSRMVLIAWNAPNGSGRGGRTAVQSSTGSGTTSGRRPRSAWLEAARLG